MGTRRHLLLAATAALALAGCASWTSSLTVELSTFGEWPAGRSAGSYAFERLPSQLGDGGKAQAALEAAARPALARAGFTEAPAGQAPAYLVQLGASLNRMVGPVWEDPLWWNGSFGWRSGRPWGGPYWGLSLRLPPASFQRNAALLVRDRETGKPLFEAHVRDNNAAPGDPRELQGMFDAALIDFPKPGINPRRVTVPLAPAAAAK